MHNPTPLVLGLVLCAFATGQTPVADARDRLPTPLEELARPPAHDLPGAWFQLWGECVTEDETWLMRVTSPMGGECLVQNCQERMGRFRMVVEIPLSRDDAHAADEADLVCDLLHSGYAVFAVGGILETPRGRVPLVGLDIRNELGSLIIPWAVVSQAGLVAATQDTQAELQAGGGAPSPASGTGGPLALGPEIRSSPSVTEPGGTTGAGLTLGKSLSPDWNSAAALDEESDFRVSTMALGALLLLLGAALAQGRYGGAADKLTSNPTWQGWLRRHFGGA